MPTLRKFKKGQFHGNRYTELLMNVKLGITLAHQILGLAQKNYLNTSKLADLAELITKSYITCKLEDKRESADYIPGRI